MVVPLKSEVLVEPLVETSASIVHEGRQSVDLLKFPETQQRHLKWHL